MNSIIFQLNSLISISPMLRIYLDKQIISYLQKPLNGKEETYKELYNLLRENESQLCLLYSVGHFMDSLNDLSTYRDADLRYMATIGFKHFIRYDFESSRMYITTSPPLEAYKRGKFNIKVDYRLRTESPVFTQQQLAFKAIFKEYYIILKKVKDNNGNPKILSQREKDYYEGFRKMVPFNFDDITERKFIKYLQKYYEKLKSNATEKFNPFVKDIINSTKSKFILPNFNKDFSKPNLKKELFNSQLQSFFIDLLCMHILSSNVGQKNFDYSKISNEFSLHIYYNMLEFTGILNEPPKKLKIQNMVADSVHAVFGCYCDVLVTEDNKLFEKSKLLYGLLDMNTLVFKPEEFLSYYKSYRNSVVLDKDQIINFCQSEVYRFLVKQKEEYGSLWNTYFIDSQFHYISFFNTIHYESVDTFYRVNLIRLTNNYYNPWTLEEVIELVSISTKVFGPDISGRTSLDEHLEVMEIQRNRWRGRQWFFSGIEIILTSNLTDNHVFTLSISPFKSATI